MLQPLLVALIGGSGFVRIFFVFFLSFGSLAIPLKCVARDWVDVVLEGIYRGNFLLSGELPSGFFWDQENGKSFLRYHVQDPLPAASIENSKESIPYQDHYSQMDADGVYFEDKLIELFKIEDGIFIEVGANDGIYQSTTKKLEEKLHWKGILIEPSPSAYKRLCLNRPSNYCFQCALGAFEEENTRVIGNFDGDAQSKVGGVRGDFSSIAVPVRSLQSILDEVGISHVNFFSLDTEGYEFNILRGIDFSRTTFDYLLVEINSKDYKAIVSFLDQNNYELVCNFSGYCLEKNPGWTGNHNDYLFKHKGL